MDIEEEKIKMKKLEELMKKEKYPDKPLTLNEKSMNEAIEKYPLVIVDCWAVWCPPCRMISPLIENLAKKYKGKIIFGKLNIDENRSVAINFKINAIPCLLVFKEKKLIDRIIGAMPEEILEEKIKKYL